MSNEISIIFPRQSNLDIIHDVPEEEGTIQPECASLSSSQLVWKIKSMGNVLLISLDNDQSTVIPLHNEMTVQEVVESTCSRRQLNPDAFYLRLGVEDSSGATGQENKNIQQTIFMFCSVDNIYDHNYFIMCMN